MLIIGGGVAGCCTAIKLDENINAVMTEKGGLIERSGACGMGGPDNIFVVPRDGVTALSFVKSLRENGIPPYLEPKSGLLDENLNYIETAYKMWAIEELEKAGCNLRWDDGEYEWIYWPDETPGRKTCLHIHGHNFKPQLAAAVRRKRNVKVLERTMVTDLLTKDGRVVGATAINIRTGEFIIIKSKMTVIASGGCERIYEPEAGSTNYKMVYHIYPSSGDGLAMAYRAGASLINMEFAYPVLHPCDFLVVHYGFVAHFAQRGIAAKIFDANGNYVCDPPLSIAKYIELEERGLTPLYYGVEYLPDEDHHVREIFIADIEPSYFWYSEQRGFDVRKHRVELQPLKPAGLTGSYPGLAGILVDENGKTTLEGLYAAGDVIGGIHYRSVGAAAVLGFRIGMQAKEVIHNLEEPAIDYDQVQACKEKLLTHLSIKEGVEPLEYESKIRSICEKYAGRILTDGKLMAGLRRLEDVKNDWMQRIKAVNFHQLMRAIECRNLTDVAEIHMRCALERKESRHFFFRRDYPKKNPQFDEKAIEVKLKDGKMVFELRSMPKLKPEYESEGG